MLELGCTDAPPYIVQYCVYDNHHCHDKREHLSAALLVLLQEVPVTEIIKDKSELNPNAQRNKANTANHSEPLLDKQNTFLAAWTPAFDFLALDFAFPEDAGVENAEDQPGQANRQNRKHHVAIVEYESGKGMADQQEQIHVQQVRVIDAWTLTAEPTATASFFQLRRLVDTIRYVLTIAAF